MSMDGWMDGWMECGTQCTNNLTSYMCRGQYYFAVIWMDVSILYGNYAELKLSQETTAPLAWIPSESTSSLRGQDSQPTRSHHQCQRPTSDTLATFHITFYSTLTHNLCPISRTNMNLMWSAQRPRTASYQRDSFLVVGPASFDEISSLVRFHSLGEISLQPIYNTTIHVSNLHFYCFMIPYDIPSLHVPTVEFHQESISMDGFPSCGNCVLKTVDGPTTHRKGGWRGTTGHNDETHTIHYSQTYLKYYLLNAQYIILMTYPLLNTL